MIEAIKSTGVRLIILPTGSGKTAVALGPTFLASQVQGPHYGLTVFVAPTNVLRDEMVERCQDVHVKVHVYPVKDERGIVRGAGAGLNGLLIVTADQVSSASFDIFYASCDVKRVVIDEVHLFLTDGNYRPALASIIKVRALAVPLILLTATLPPSLLSPLKKLLQVDLPPTDVIRFSSLRLNISLDLIKVNGDNEALSSTADLLQCFLKVYRNTNSRALVFCQTRDEVVTVASELNKTLRTTTVGAYRSPSQTARETLKKGWLPLSSMVGDDLEDARGILRLAEFKDTDSQSTMVLATTSSLLQAMDYPVRL